MKCPRCGQTLLQEAEFCPYCKSPLEENSIKDFLNEFETKRAKTTIGLKEAVKELKHIGFSTIFPFSQWIKDKPWNLLWVRWLIFLTLFPLFIWYWVESAELAFGDIAFAFGIYFASIWGLVIYVILKPERALKKDIFRIGFFTAIIGTLLVLILQKIPPISSLYKATAASSFMSRIIGFVLGVGVIEEFSKALPLLWFYGKKQKEDSLPTIIFLGCVSGFAFGVSEAVAYSLSYVLNLGFGFWGFGEYTAAQFTRLITLPFLHAVWAGTSSYFIALGVQNRKVFRGLFLAGLGLAALMHGLYNTLCASFLGFLVAVVSIIIFVAYIRSSEVIQKKIQEVTIS